MVEQIPRQPPPRERPPMPPPRPNEGLIGYIEKGREPAGDSRPDRPQRERRAK